MKDFSRVLVTGGAGSIGSHLVDRLMGMGCFVRVVDGLSSGSLENVKLWFGLSAGELLSLGWKPALNGEEAVRLGCRGLLRSMAKSSSKISSGSIR